MIMSLSHPEKSEVLIIGGGPAGAACAIRLRQHGIGVQIAEKAAFPRSKVCGCCLGGAGLGALEQLGLSEWAADVGIPVGRWVGAFDGRRVEVTLPRGRVISRELLDTQLLQTARTLGAVVDQPCVAEARQQNESGVPVELHWQRNAISVVHSYAVAVIASGLNAGSHGRQLPWLQTPHGPYGAGLTLPPERVVLNDAASSQPGTIYMACEDKGYVGLVVLPDGRVDVAAALYRLPQSRPRRRQYPRVQPAAQVAAILRRSSLADLDILPQDGLTATPLLRRRRLAGRGRMIAIGDAAGYVEPFTGEGMTWGMLSGIAAADLIAATDSWNSLGEKWQRQESRLLENRRRKCRWMTTALRSSLVRRTAGATLSRFPALAKPLVAGLD